MKLPGVSDKDVHRSVRKGVLLKTYYALKAGHLNWREVWRRGTESVKNVLGIGFLGGTK